MGQESHIASAAWSARYLKAFDRLLGIEGGYVDDPADRGGATKFGISLRFLVGEGDIDRNRDGFADFDLDFDGDIDGADIRALTIDHAKSLCHRCFWQRLDVEGLPRPIGEIVFDQAVNGGLKAAVKMLQQALVLCGQRVAIDGAIGPATRGAVQRVLQMPGTGMPALVAAYREAARGRYRQIVAAVPSQKRFLKGWLRRADELGRGW